MHAHDRFLPDWFARIRSRQITLPRFQRDVAWSHALVSDLLTTVVRGLPAGASLILQVGDEEKFISRTMVDAPETGEKVTEQLLDGQQRLTALWRSLNDKYPDRTYLIAFEEDPDSDQSLPVVHGQARWTKNGNRYPMWVDDPRECWARDYIPLRLLRPDVGEVGGASEMRNEIDEWIEATMSDEEPDRYAAYKRLSNIITDLRTRVREFNLPYLALPASTPKDVALDVFIKMNTSSVKLSTYDIVVALVEDETGRSLHDHVAQLEEAVPRAGTYADLPGLILDVVALRQDTLPSQAGYRSLDYTRMINEWDRLVTSIRGMVNFLEEEAVFDAQRLPSYPALPVLAALWEHLPKQPDALGNARHLLRCYLWRAFLTTRYEAATTNSSLQDFRALRRVLTTGAAPSTVPILNDTTYPVPTKELILQADWPRRRNILSRGLLALQLKCGAEDLADGVKASVASIVNTAQPREYHHLFPDSLLESAGVPDADSSRAVNCALITWRTNRTISNKDPLTYLRERAETNTLGQDELRRRLATHLVPYQELAVSYNGLDGPDRATQIQSDYARFADKRAELLARAAALACAGQPVQPHTVFEPTDWGHP